MFELGFASVRDFAKELAVPYMQVYNCVSGRTYEMPVLLKMRIAEKFPNVSKDFLYNMSGEPLKTATVPKFQENDIEQEPEPSTDNPLSNTEMFALLNRVTTHHEKVQKTQDNLINGINRITALENNYRELINELKSKK